MAASSVRAGVEGIPGIEFGHYAEVDKPVHLEGFPEITGRVRRDVGADAGDALEFLLTHGVVLFICAFTCRLCVALGESD